MRALIDADILLYEVGYGAETAYRGMKKDLDLEEGGLPDFEFVERMLTQRLAYIVDESGADEYELFLTEGPTFREAIATLKPYKGTRKHDKPFHFTNLFVYIKDVLNATIVPGLEADDALALEHIKGGDTVLCSRDKDLRQVPGRFFSWELGRQASFGPVDIDIVGSLKLSNDNKKLTGTGYAFFCAQMLMGDPVDNIPGLPGAGPKRAYEVLSFVDTAWNIPDYKRCPDLLNQVESAYYEHYRTGWEERMLEQGRLLWMTRELHEDGSPVLWEIGMWERSYETT